MRLIKPLISTLFGTLVLLGLTQQVHAGREARSEVNILLPYAFGKDIGFDGGASADLEEDLGIGFGYAYNYTDNWAFRVDMTWNSSNYAGHRIVDSSNTGFYGNLDTIKLLFGADYYFVTGRFAPYVNLNAGWTYIDSNSGNLPSSSAVCWKEPWLAESCSDSARSGYSEKNMVGGLGLGVRMEVARRNFIRVGYYLEIIDFDQASDPEEMGTLRFEFGFLY